MSVSVMFHIELLPAYHQNAAGIIIALSFASTQIPHAVGAAYSLKMEGKDACIVTYFGDGGTSTVNIATLLVLTSQKQYSGCLDAACNGVVPLHLNGI